MAEAIAPELAAEVDRLLAAHGVPLAAEDRSDGGDRLVMVSTHGHWGDPPPAGATDTGGQTLYVLQISKEWARAGRKVLILARWFAPAARVERLEPDLWLVRVPAGGDGFVRKEDLYPWTPVLAEAATAVAARFGARAVMGHYADGMVIAAEVALRLDLPLLAMPHSLALTKIEGLGMDAGDPATWIDQRYRFGDREACELAAMAQADGVVECLPGQLDVLSRAYRLAVRREVVTPGVAEVFFDAGDRPPDVEVPARFGLVPGRYLVATGRLAETKNLAGAVALLGELRALARGRLDDVALALVGGRPDPREPEELAVERSIAAAMADHGLSSRDVVRVPAQAWPAVAQLLRQALFYVGMQRFEPFGMGAAEALAVGAPVLLSDRAGIARALEGAGSPAAVLVDPADPRAAARRLLEALDAPDRLAAMRAAGRELAREAFRWSAAAARLGARLDDLIERGAADPARARRAGGQHRLIAPWRGDRPRPAPAHLRAAEQLLPHILEASAVEERAGRRLIVALGGESGAGKTEIAHCLAIALRRLGLGSALLPGDVYFRLPPDENHRARLAAERAGDLEAYLGPPREVDLAGLERTLAAAADRRNPVVACPSDCRPLGRRYERVSLDLAGCDVVLVDLTYAMLLGGADLRVFLESDHLERLESLRRRNAARDPDQDFGFIRTVLALEHQRIQRSAARADLVVDARGGVRDGAAGSVERASSGAAIGPRAALSRLTEG
ncbi:MAG TPA: glycosyltransferase [Kofleriaceae bacterium]|nr:glycosyltransferase [Kofleriaceae bacterium]